MLHTFPILMKLALHVYLQLFITFFPKLKKKSEKSFDCIFYTIKHFLNGNNKPHIMLPSWIFCYRISGRRPSFPTFVLFILHLRASLSDLGKVILALLYYSQTLYTNTLRKWYIHFLSQWMGYDRDDSFWTKWNFHLV